MPEATVAQRIVRARKTLSEAGAAFELPAPEMLGRRLASVLEVVYFVFNEGYTAISGGDWMRPALCGEALRLARMLAELAPQEPETHGLAALLELQSSTTSRRKSRCRNTSGCRVCAAICSRSWGARTKRGWSSSGRRGWRRMRGSGN